MSPKWLIFCRIVSRIKLTNYLIASKRQQSFSLGSGWGKNKQIGKGRLNITKVNQNSYNQYKKYKLQIPKFRSPPKLHHTILEQFMTPCEIQPYVNHKGKFTLPQKESGKRSPAKGVWQKSDEESERSIRKSDQKVTATQLLMNIHF